MNISEEQFKLALATDLIVYMIKVWTKNSNNQNEIVDNLLDAWIERIEKGAYYMKKQIAQQMIEVSEDMTEDIAMILLDISNIENNIIKDEFKNQMRESILKGLAIIDIK